MDDVQKSPLTWVWWLLFKVVMTTIRPFNFEMYLSRSEISDTPSQSVSYRRLKKQLLRVCTTILSHTKRGRGMMLRFCFASCRFFYTNIELTWWLKIRSNQHRNFIHGIVPLNIPLEWHYARWTHGVIVHLTNGHFYRSLKIFITKDPFTLGDMSQRHDARRFNGGWELSK